jgi:hypothetical protein
MVQLAEGIAGDRLDRVIDSFMMGATESRIHTAHVPEVPAEHEQESARIVNVDPERSEIDRVAQLLIAEWERVEKQPVNVSRVATFADLARVAIADCPGTRAMLQLPPSKEWDAESHDRGDVRESDGYESSDYVDGWNEALNAVAAVSPDAVAAVSPGTVDGGKEAEKLREGIEELIKTIDDDTDTGQFREALQNLLDSVDAGDSLGHLQRQKVPSPALIEGAPRERDGQQRAPHQRLDVRPDLVKAYLSNLIALHTLNESLALHALNQNPSTGSESSAGWSDAALLETVQHALDRVWNTMSEDARRETERRLRAEG